MSEVVTHSKFKSRTLSLVQKYESEAALRRVGDHSTFQLFMAFTLILTIASQGMVIYGLGFLSRMPRFYCGDTLCSQQEACLRQKSVYRAEYQDDKTNLIRRLSLECTSSSQIGLIGSIYFIGVTLGALVIPSLSDRFGRKLLILISNLIHLLAVGGILLSSSLLMIYLSFFALGFKATGAMHITYIYINEVVRKDRRALYSTIACLIDCCNTLALPFYYYTFSDYIPLFIANISLVVILSALTIWRIPESPRYLLVHQKFIEATSSLNQIARCNGVAPLNPNSEMVSPEISQSNSRIYSSTNDINSSLAIFSVCLLFMTYTSFAIVFGINYLERNIYIVGVAVGVGEVCGTVASGLLALCLGRRQTFILSCLISAFSALFAVLARLNHFYSGYGYLFILIAKAGNSAGLNVFYLLIAETYPTSMRGTAFGIINTVGRLGGLLAPLVTEYFQHSGMLMGTIAGVNFLMVLLSLNVEETRNKPLEDKLE